MCDVHFRALVAPSTMEDVAPITAYDLIVRPHGNLASKGDVEIVVKPTTTAQPFKDIVTSELGFTPACNVLILSSRSV